MRTFNEPDRTAPRYREKIFNPLNKVLYERFLMKFPEYKDLSLLQFKAIVRTFNQKLWQGIIDNRDGVELPEGLGFIFMGSCPASKKKNLDIQKSIEYGIPVTHKNWDSDNQLMKIFYTNQPTKYPLQNKQVWAFKAVREFRSTASAIYRQDWPKYIVVDNTRKISSMFVRIKRKDYLMTKNAIVPDDWNEFKF